VRQEVVDAGSGMGVDAEEHVLEISDGIDGIGLAGGDERVEPPGNGNDNKGGNGNGGGQDTHAARIYTGQVGVIDRFGNEGRWDGRRDCAA
jgi:hypothetical protein